MWVKKEKIWLIHYLQFVLDFKLTPLKRKSLPSRRVKANQAILKLKELKNITLILHAIVFFSSFAHTYRLSFNSCLWTISKEYLINTISLLWKGKIHYNDTNIFKLIWIYKMSRKKHGIWSLNKRKVVTKKKGFYLMTKDLQSQYESSRAPSKW